MVLEKQKFAKEYLKVLQETLPKERLADILSGIAVGEDVSVLLEKAMLEAKSPLEQEVHEAVQPFNPKNVNPLELVQSLRGNVVRLVFYKVDGSRRIMYATRNPDIIKLYDADSKNPNKPNKADVSDLDNQEKIEQQIERDAIRVFDLEKDEFRAFKPSRLAEFDNGDSVGSWIEFKPEYDSWYIMAKEEGDIHKYYVGNRMVKNIGKSPSRREYEAQARQDLQDAIYTREQNEKREEQLANDPEHQAKMKKMKLESALGLLLNKHMAKFNGAELSANFDDVFYFGKDFIERLVQAQPSIAKLEKVYEKERLILFSMFDNVIIFHPHVLFDTTAKHVFYDLTGCFKSSQTVPPEVRNEEQILRGLPEFIDKNAPKTRKPLNPRYTDKDKQRAIRVNAIIKQFPIDAKYGVTMTQKGLVTTIKPLHSDIDLTLTITPYVANLQYTQGRTRNIELSRRATPTSSVSHVDETIAALGTMYSTSKLEGYVKVIKSLDVLSTAYNLRTVKFEEERILLD